MRSEIFFVALLATGALADASARMSLGVPNRHSHFKTDPSKFQIQNPNQNQDQNPQQNDPSNQPGSKGKFGQAMKAVSTAVKILKAVRPRDIDMVLDLDHELRARDLDAREAELEALATELHARDVGYDWDGDYFGEMPLLARDEGLEIRDPGLDFDGKFDELRFEAREADAEPEEESEFFA